MAAAKAKADLDLARAQQKQDAAKKPQPSSGAATQHAESPPGAAAEQAGPPSGDSDLADQVAAAQEASAQAAATQALISGAITSIDAFTTAVNATAAGTRSPLALAALNELLHEGASASDTSTSASDSGFGYVLMVKGLGGQSEEYTKDRHIGFDTYTTLADASVAFMLYDVTARKVIKSGIANGVSSVHGHLGHPPTGLLGPNAEDVIDDQSADAEPGPHQPGQQPGPPAAPSKSWWRRMF